MSDNLKIQKFKITTIENFCQKLKVCYFWYINCERQPISGPVLCIVNAKTVQSLVLGVTEVFVPCVRLRTQPKIFKKIHLKRKNQTFWFMEKHISYNFHKWKNVYHRDFIQFSVRMELYDKKFLIYGNCMIRSFGHTGKLLVCLIFPKKILACSKTCI